MDCNNDNPYLHTWCGRSHCPGVWVEMDGMILCSESAKEVLAGAEEGGEGG